MITDEQEALLRAFAQFKKMRFGEFTIFLQGGNLVRYEIRKSISLLDKAAPTGVVAEPLKDAVKELAELEEEGVVAI